MAFIHDDFLLSAPAARRLYHQFAASEPILDYHCHLPPADVATNRKFNNLFEIWLEGDHYKWRAMRLNGVQEHLCTGNASPFEKFKAWAATVPQTLRNPLYHWTHLELKRYFGIEELLNESTAESIWNRAKEQLATPAFSAHRILEKFKVTALCTTDDPTDDLQHHKTIAASKLATRVLPTFRPDKALAVHQTAPFNDWVNKLGAAAHADIGSFPAFLDALRKRHQYFHEHGCRLSDHGLNHCYPVTAKEAEASAIFTRARAGKPISADDHSLFAGFMMLFFGRLDAEKGWTKQLHLGALRSPNARALRELGPDTGFDAMGDWQQAIPLAAYLNALDSEDALPKTIIYNLNPADNYAMATMCGTFQRGTVSAKVQFGSGWWHLDQQEGMEWQMNALSNLGLISKFIGMITDSRSFMSYPRHEYFRRTLCNLFGRDIAAGLLPDDEALNGSIIKNICHANALRYLNLPQR